MGGAVPVKDEENPLLGVRSSSKRPRSFAYGVIAVVCVAALAISGTGRSSREDLSALGDLSNAYLARGPGDLARPWWREVKTANDTLITAKRASDEAMEAAAEAEEKFDELKLDAEEKDRMCADIDKAENQTAGCDDHCSTGAVQASRLGWGSRSWSRSWSSWWRSIRQRAAEAAKKAAEAKKVKCMNTCKTLKCSAQQCKKVPEGSELFLRCMGSRRDVVYGLYIRGIDESRKYFKCFGIGARCNTPSNWREPMYSFPQEWFHKSGCGVDKCRNIVRVTYQDRRGRRVFSPPGVGSDYWSECGKCIDE